MPAPLIVGSSLNDLVRAFKGRKREERFERLIARFDKGAQEQLRGRIDASAWFPVDLYTGFLEAVVREVHKGDESRLTEGAERFFEKMLTGVYRLYIQLGSPALVIEKISAVHNQYFKNVDIAVLSIEEGKAVLRFGGLERKHRVIEHVLRAFYKKALELCGGREVRVEFTVPIGQGRDSELSLSWR